MRRSFARLGVLAAFLALAARGPGLATAATFAANGNDYKTRTDGTIGAKPPASSFKGYGYCSTVLTAKPLEASSTTNGGSTGSLSSGGTFKFTTTGGAPNDANHPGLEIKLEDIYEVHCTQETESLADSMCAAERQAKAPFSKNVTFRKTSSPATKTEYGCAADCPGEGFSSCENPDIFQESVVRYGAAATINIADTKSTNEYGNGDIAYVAEHTFGSASGFVSTVFVDPDDDPRPQDPKGANFGTAVAADVKNLGTTGRSICVPSPASKAGTTVDTGPVGCPEQELHPGQRAFRSIFGFRRFPWAMTRSPTDKIMNKNYAGVQDFDKRRVCMDITLKCTDSAHSLGPDAENGIVACEFYEKLNGPQKDLEKEGEVRETMTAQFVMDTYTTSSLEARGKTSFLKPARTCTGVSGGLKCTFCGDYHDVQSGPMFVSLSGSYREEYTPWKDVHTTTVIVVVVLFVFFVSTAIVVYKWREHVKDARLVRGGKVHTTKVAKRLRKASSRRSQKDIDASKRNSVGNPILDPEAAADYDKVTFASLPAAGQKGEPDMRPFDFKDNQDEFVGPLSPNSSANQSAQAIINQSLTEDDSEKYLHSWADAGDDMGDFLDDDDLGDFGDIDDLSPGFHMGPELDYRTGKRLESINMDSKPMDYKSSSGLMAGLDTQGRVAM